MRPGEKLLAIIGNEFSEGDILQLLLTGGQLVNMEVGTVCNSRGLLFGRTFPGGQSITVRGSTIAAFIEVQTKGEEE